MEMTMEEALAYLADGHNVMTVGGAQAVCRLLGVPFEGMLVFRWENAQDAFDRYGFFAQDGESGAGVNGLDLSYYVARCLGLGAPGVRYSGRGFQAQANAWAIRGYVEGLAHAASEEGGSDGNNG